MLPAYRVTARHNTSILSCDIIHSCAYDRPTRSAAVTRQRTARPLSRREQRIGRPPSPCIFLDSCVFQRASSAKHSPPTEEEPSPSSPENAHPSPRATDYRVSRRVSGFAAASAACSLLWQRAQPAAASNVRPPQPQPRRPAPPPAAAEEPVPQQVAHVRQLTQQAEAAADAGDYQQVRWPSCSGGICGISTGKTL